MSMRKCGLQPWERCYNSKFSPRILMIMQFAVAVIKPDETVVPKHVSRAVSLFIKKAGNAGFCELAAVSVVGLGLEWKFCASCMDVKAMKIDSRLPYCSCILH